MLPGNKNSLASRLAMAAVVSLVVVACDGSSPSTTAGDSAAIEAPETLTVPTTETAAATTTVETATTETPAASVPEPIAATTPLPPTTAAVSETDSITAAADHYIEIVTPSNCAGERLLDAQRAAAGTDDTRVDEAEWPAYRDATRPAWEDYRDELQYFVDGLIEYEWPSSVQETVDELVTEIAAGVSYSDTEANFTDFSDWVELDTAFPSSPSAAVLRSMLDLESYSDGETNDCD